MNKIVNLIFQSQKPEFSLSDFVESFWMLDNPSEHKEVILLPDGRIDLIFSQSPTEPLHVVLLGIGTHPEHVIITEKTKIFAVSFNLLATEYILHQSISELLNSAKILPADFWNFFPTSLILLGRLKNFQDFCQKN
jgi:hypothetical protein